MIGKINKNQLNTTKRVALYARVSTLDKGQNPETQLVQLCHNTQTRNFKVITEFIDYASGTSEDRMQYRLMMAAAKKRKIDVVLVFANTLLCVWPYRLPNNECLSSKSPLRHPMIMHVHRARK